MLSQIRQLIQTRNELCKKRKGWLLQSCRQDAVSTHLLVSVAFPDVHTGQVCHNERPQLLVCSELKQNKAHQQRSQNTPVPNPELVHPVFNIYKKKENTQIWCLLFSYKQILLTWTVFGRGKSEQIQLIQTLHFQPHLPGAPHNHKPSHHTGYCEKKNLTLSAVVNCASALSMQLTEMQ